MARTQTYPTGSWSKRGLWPHQVEALTTIESFLQARRGRAGPSAMVRMPTGTGKSGVIAVAAQQLVTTGDVLLLTPWVALVEQLTRDVRERFWARIDMAAPTDKAIVRLFPSKADRLLDEYRSPVIWCSTITTIQQLAAGYEEAYRELQKRLRLVVVDEGHYEPALTWSQAVRGLGRPTVLLTATPYRNDFKYFELDAAHIFHYTHQQAEVDHIVRGLDCEPIAFSDPETFCNELISTVTRRKTDLPDAKIIVRCDSKSSVQNVVDELSKRGETVVGIHERFPTGSGVLRRTVPKPDECDATYWVHQFKMTEGIDSSDFRLVAFYRPFESERAFIQQVGRVLRNPSGSPTEHGILVYRATDALNASWAAYINYDAATGRGDALSPLEVAASQPPPFYFDGKFRDSFDLLQRSVETKDLVYPRSAKVFYRPSAFDIDAFEAEVDRVLDEKDCVNRQVLRPSTDMRLHVYLAIHSSPILARDAFYQSSLGYTIYRSVGQYFFYYDSFGQRPNRLGTFRQVGPDRLRRLFHGSGARLASVSLANTDLGQFSARRRSLHAPSIDALGPDLSDHAHMATTATGYHESFTADGDSRMASRYVGFTRGRVTDRGLVPFDDYIKWIDRIAAILDDDRVAPPAVFDRYAEVIDAPSEVAPQSILFDFPFPVDRFVDRAGADGEGLTIDDLCMEVNNGVFTCRANGDDFEVGISWSAVGHRYLLSSSELDERFALQDVIGGERSQTLIGYLNQSQAFRVVPATGRNDYCIYTGRLFCRPRLPLGPKGRVANPALLGLLVGCTELGSIGEEKGKKGTASAATSAGWAEGTLFGLIDRLGIDSALEAHMAGVSTLVCDDMGTEIADFIALDPLAKRAIAIHAKASSERKLLSASVFHEVTAQAVKNLGSFEPYFVRDPKNLNLWNKAWRGPAGMVSKRIRHGSGSPTAIWGQFRDALRDPTWTREVWLVVGQGSSKRLIVEESAKEIPRAELVQLLYSLQATWGAVSAVGNVLRVFISE